MAWIIDPNFGSTHYAVAATSPFPTGGGNRVVIGGAGVVYENSNSASNLSIRCDFVHRGPIFGSSKGFGVGIRDASGNIYFCELWYSNNFLVVGNQLATQLTKYRQATDTFVGLVTFAIFAHSPIIDEILAIEFRKSLSSISILVNGNVAASISDSEFVGPFNMCLIGSVGQQVSNASFIEKEIDNLSFNAI